MNCKNIFGSIGVITIFTYLNYCITLIINESFNLEIFASLFVIELLCFMLLLYIKISNRFSEEFKNNILGCILVFWLIILVAYLYIYFTFINIKIIKIYLGQIQINTNILYAIANLLLMIELFCIIGFAYIFNIIKEYLENSREYERFSEN